jgi:cyclopropane-fatty-acyl-phospholipid synthase
MPQQASNLPATHSVRTAPRRRRRPIIGSARSLIAQMLKARIHIGTLTLRMPDGVHMSFGQGEPAAEMVVREDAALRRILRDPGLELGETYMEGGWEAGEGGLRKLIEVLMRNFAEAHPEGAERLALPLLKLVQQSNRIGRSRRNVSHHYDLDESLFRTFLDDGMFYSCAYFAREDMTLEEAQQAKCRLLMDKLRLQPGMRVLDIGSGWGGLAIYLAEHAGVEVDGVTLSTEQLRVAQAEAERRGLSDRVRFHLRDYREQDGVFDRIVSVGMFEHVGEPQFSTFFRKVESLLAPDGIAVLHTIGATGVPGQTNAWIRRHIFPGGYIPSLSQITHRVEQVNGLVYTDVEVLRQHYAWTLAEWYRRFQERRAEIAERMGETFCRMWEFYLATSEGSFLWWDLVVFHVQLTHGHGPVPVTRDYLCHTE